MSGMAKYYITLRKKVDEGKLDKILVLKEADNLLNGRNDIIKQMNRDVAETGKIRPETRDIFISFVKKAKDMRPILDLYSKGHQYSDIMQDFCWQCEMGENGKKGHLY